MAAVIINIILSLAAVVVLVLDKKGRIDRAAAWVSAVYFACPILAAAALTVYLTVSNDWSWFDLNLDIKELDTDTRAFLEGIAHGSLATVIIAFAASAPALIAGAAGLIGVIREKVRRGDISGALGNCSAASAAGLIAGLVCAAAGSIAAAFALTTAAKGFIGIAVTAVILGALTFGIALVVIAIIMPLIMIALSMEAAIVCMPLIGICIAFGVLFCCMHIISAAGGMGISAAMFKSGRIDKNQSVRAIIMSGIPFVNLFSFISLKKRAGCPRGQVTP